MGEDLDHEHRQLAGIGIDEVEERVYLGLVQSAGGSINEIVASTGVASGRARAALAALEEKGLVGRSAERPITYWPAPPETAIEMLVVRRQEELERARQAARRLEDQLSTAVRPAASPAGVVEVIAGGDAVVNRNKQLLMGAQREILGFTCKPLAAPHAEFTSFKLAVLGRGVTGRVVYALDVLEMPGVVEFIEATQPAGEQARTVASLPMPLLIVDRQVGFLPLGTDRPNYFHDFLLVHRSALLETLIMVFESVWERAAPFDSGLSPSVGNDGKAWSPSTDERRMLALLATGMKDAAVARQLGIGPRTVERRLRRIMEELDTMTRFQTATEAARRGWIGVPPK